MAENVCYENVLQFYVYNDSYNLQLHEVKEKCLQFMEERSNSCSILKSQSFLELPQQSVISLLSHDRFVVPEKDILEAVLKWKLHNGKNTEEITKIIECIRLSQLPMQEIFTVAEPTKLFSDACLLAGIRALIKPDLSQTRPRGRICEFIYMCIQYTVFPQIETVLKSL